MRAFIENKCWRTTAKKWLNEQELKAEGRTERERQKRLCARGHFHFALFVSAQII